MEKLAELLTTKYLGRHSELLQSCPSTNNLAKERFAELEHGALIYTTNQFAGKGRNGKAWENSAGDMLAMTLTLHNIAPQQMAALTLCTGLAVASALGEEAQIKWPNDVILGGGKLCGILCEGRISSVAVGIGVNLKQSAEQFKQNGIPHATSLLIQRGCEPKAEHICANILNAFEPLLEAYLQGGFAAIKKSYKARCITLGREVRVVYKSTELQGTAVYVNDDGTLLVATGDGAMLRIDSGEASVRGVYGYAF
ncbi:MAG: biotin--[acetyl-CoA-carboxylase] ligase [Oscillospiraceae bacterium]|jgi:BirA family biotin operon repressor/biotin-[acetyl-CoA-carboxylase] ligase|nr:biotin--[acetyl-CoA-carboxylase] ligase [Oscillospiraceae bacterium]